MDVNDLINLDENALLQFFQKHNFYSYEICDIIRALNTETKCRILSNKQLICQVLRLNKYEIASLVKELELESDKENLINIYKFDSQLMTQIIKTYSDSSKVKILLQDTKLKKYDKIVLLLTFEVNSLVDFINKHKKEFFTDISPYEIIKNLSVEQQVEFLTNFENLNLTDNEKREILITLKPELKKRINVSTLSAELRSVLDIETEENSSNIILNWDSDLEIYRGLDNLLKIDPTKLTEKQKSKFLELCTICPNLKVINTIDGTGHAEYSSTIAEYRIAEEWIQTILNCLKPEYTDAQKLAIIDNAIGKKISYSPDYDTEIFDGCDCRALYKIISSGYGVCDGIARVEQYMLERIGIDCELVSSNTHAFLKLNNMEFELANGETVVGTTILDPTWNLSAHRFNGRPNNFCISYEEARTRDIDSDRNDHESHKNFELKDATFTLDNLSLRKLFQSVGLADDQGMFPFKELMDSSGLLHKKYSDQPKKNIEEQFLLLSRVCPEFATCQNSSMSILQILLNNESLKYDKCVINRVYSKLDKDKSPVMFVYIKSAELGEIFYFADKCNGAFVELPKSKFLAQFECYEADLQKSNGIRPWEDIEPQNADIDLATSSGTVIDTEEEGR